MRPVAQIAQSVEQGIENPRVGGSIPSLGTKIPRNPQGTMCPWGFFIACDFRVAGPRRFRRGIESRPTDFRYQPQH